MRAPAKRFRFLISGDFSRRNEITSCSRRSSQLGKMIPWYAAVIGGGLAILVAPMVLQLFSDRFVDGRASLVSFAVGSALIAFFLIWLAGKP
jgi:hypothetical protein